MATVLCFASMLVKTAAASMQTMLVNILEQLLSWNSIQFAAAAAITFLILGLGCYAAYGHDFLHETYLYHSGRKDPRHNFSIYFYNAYLEYGGTGASNVSW